MLERSPRLKRLPPAYLFPEVNRRKKLFLERHPGVELIDLGIGDTVLPLPQMIAEALARGGEGLGTVEGYSGYGQEQGLLVLREEICRRLYPHRSPDELFISDGAKSDLGRLQLLFGKGVRVGVQDPAYPVYVEGSLLQGVEDIVYLPCTAHNQFVPEIPRGIDLLYLCNPNNPTGKAYNHAELQYLVERAIERKMIILYDAAYFAYIQTPTLPKSIYSIPGAETVAIEIHSFSKLAGFSGVRLGWTVIPKALKFRCGHSVREDYLRLSSTVFNGASNIAQRGGLAVFSDGGWQAVQQQIQRTMENAYLLRGAFERRGYTVHGGKEAPYLWIETPARGSWELFEELMEKEHLVVTPGAGYGPSGEHHIRVSAFGHREKLLKLG